MMNWDFENMTFKLVPLDEGGYKIVPKGHPKEKEKLWQIISRANNNGNVVNLTFVANTAIDEFIKLIDDLDNNRGYLSYGELKAKLEELR
jgi:hypothetical protein